MKAVCFEIYIWVDSQIILAALIHCIPRLINIPIDIHSFGRLKLLAVTRVETQGRRQMVNFISILVFISQVWSVELGSQ